MLEDQLLLIVGLQHHRILVERPDPARQLHPTQQIDRDVALFFAGRVEEGILDVLRRLVLHLPISLPKLDSKKNQLLCCDLWRVRSQRAGGTTRDQSGVLASPIGKAGLPWDSTSYNTALRPTFQSRPALMF